MKMLAILLTYLAVHITLFFILSAIGLLWCDTYTEIIKNPNWFVAYTILIGWWTALLVTHEVYEDLYDVI
jgi:hypothetical protein